MAINRRLDIEKAWLAAGIAGYALGEDPARMMTGSSARGSREVCAARRIAMYLSYTGLGLSLSRVAIAFNRDRSTVAHACHMIEDRREDIAVDQWLAVLEQSLQQLEPMALGEGALSI